MKKKYIFLLLAFGVILILIGVTALSGNKDPMSYTYNPQAWEKKTDNSAYYNYLNEMKTDKNAVDNHLTNPIVIAASEYDIAKTDVVFDTSDGASIPDASKGYLLQKASNEAFKDAYQDTLLYAPERGTVSWEFNVTESGFYHIALRYYPIKGKSSSIERTLLINGLTPFDGASFVFHRVWTNDPNSMYTDDDNKLTFRQDLNKNDLKPNQIEAPEFRKEYLRDDLGYVTEAYRFYFEKGSNVIGLKAIKECILIDQIYIEGISTAPTYEEYRKALGEVAKVENQSIRIEAENAISKSSPTLYPITDRSSATTYPYSASTTKLNAIGGDNWKVLGDWITWSFEVKEEGLYNISLRARQNLVRGLYSTRIFYLDSEVVFEELNQTQFAYSSEWRNITLGNKDENYEFYLTPGQHTITMEVTLGEYSTLIERIQNVIDDLNRLYRDIIKYTSPAPDPSRDYRLTELEGLDMVKRMKEARNEIKAISDAIEQISGTKSDKTGVLDTVRIQLDDFIKKPNDVTKRLLTFSTNVSSLGTLLTSLREFPLSIDYLMIHTSDVKLPKANDGFFQKIWKSILSFYYSFKIDYSSIGSTEEHEGTETIEVWMSLGRDQANVIRSLIDKNFTPKTGIKVDLKLTGTDVLLKATLAGIGPNVAINVDSTLPVNYGLRDAVLDLREFEDYESVIEANSYMTDAEFNALPLDKQQWRFKPSALRQFQFNGAAYAMPEKQIFMMMFVRTDIMEELDLMDMIPKTWTEVIRLVTILQTNQLQFYLPVNDVGASSLNPIFVSMLYQMGGDLYINDNMETGLFTPIALDAFEYWTEFYTLHSFPTYANFMNRFRSGEMPLGIAYYEAYNTLSVFAPDLRGKWSFYPLPGIEKTVTDEFGVTTTYIDNTSTAAGTGTVILKGPAEKSESAKLSSWEFLKWWTSADTQVQFGREMEGILGSAARHATANVQALQQLAWPTVDYEQLALQWNSVREVPNIAGSYITGREVENAYRQVINNLVNAKETLYEYASNIQNEIDRKRTEFGLPLANKEK